MSAEYLLCARHCQGTWARLANKVRNRMNNAPSSPELHSHGLNARGELSAGMRGAWRRRVEGVEGMGLMSEAL